MILNFNLSSRIKRKKLVSVSNPKTYEIASGACESNNNHEDLEETTDRSEHFGFLLPMELFIDHGRSFFGYYKMTPNKYFAGSKK